MIRARPTVVLLVVTLVAAACASDPSTAAPADSASSPSSVVMPSTTTSAATAPPPSVAPTTTSPLCSVPTTGLHNYQFQGRERSYDIVGPDVIVEETPVLLLLHGFTSRPDRILRHSGFDRLGPENGIVVIAPLATGDPTSWEIIPPNDPDDPTYDGPNDLGFLTELVQTIRTDHPCLGDVWAAGLSAGSAMAGFYMCSEPDGLVGVGLVAALIPAVCEPASVDHMFIFHGTDDVVVPYGGGDQAVDDGSFALPGIETSASAWAELAGCDAGELTTLAADVELRAFPNCAAGSSVQLHSYLGGNHNWPGGADDQLPPIIGSLPVTCVLLHEMTGAVGDVYEACVVR